MAGSIYTGSALTGIKFCLSHPDIFPKILTFTLTSGFGQIFIYFTLKQFGSLATSIITTSRKFFTILLSILLYGHSLGMIQWISVIIVFCGLSLDLFFSWKSKQVGKLVNVKLQDKQQ